MPKENEDRVRNKECPYAVNDTLNHSFESVLEVYIEKIFIFFG